MKILNSLLLVLIDDGRNHVSLIQICPQSHSVLDFTSDRKLRFLEPSQQLNIVHSKVKRFASAIFRQKMSNENSKHISCQ